MDAGEITGWLRLFIEPGQVTELRALGVCMDGRYTRTEAGFFDYDHLSAMAKAAVELSPVATGIYFIPNPVDPALLARCANRMRTVKHDDSVSDKHILARKWLLVDADPVRVDGVSSTDEEKQHAWETIQQAGTLCGHFGIKEMVLADSGNGYHLLCRVECERDDGGLAQRFLKRLADQLDNDKVRIDRKVFNPARIVKLYGTLARKGDSTPERPHRESKVLRMLEGVEA